MRMILTDNKGLKHMIGLRHFYAKPDRTVFILCIYLVFMLVTALALEFTAFRLIRKEQGWSRLVVGTYSLFVLNMFFWALVWKSDPGYLKRDPRFDFKTLLETFDSRGMCPTC